MKYLYDNLSNKVSKVQKLNFNKITQLEDRLSTLID